MYQETVQHFADIAAKKAAFLKENPVGFFIGAMMAGAYVGIGIILIMSVGNSVPAALAKVAMGLSFGIALTLVIFAGSELFTGYTMYMTLGRLCGTIKSNVIGTSWAYTWVGNFAGAVLLVCIFYVGGAGGFLDQPTAILHKVAQYKVESSALSLFARAILCNWLVCLAIWSASRTKNDMAKLVLIFWCLFAFITSGFEHSIANMSVLTMSYLGAHAETLTFASIGKNLFWVTLGNIIGGTLFVAVTYWKSSYSSRNSLDYCHEIERHGH